MTVQHTAIFHCQACGRIVSQPHGRPTPACCGALMSCAVANVDHPGKDDTEKDVAAEEVAALSRWCHAVVDEDGSRYAELARRLRSLHFTLLDRFNLEEQADANAIISNARFDQDVTRLRQQQRDSLERLDHLIHDLHQGEAGFRGWAEVCDRFDSCVADYERHERAEVELERAAIEESRTI